MFTIHIASFAIGVFVGIILVAFFAFLAMAGKDD